MDRLAHLVRVEHAHLPKCRLERTHAGSEADGRLHDAGEEHEAGEVILQLLDLRPIACLERLVLLDVAERIEVRETGNGAVRAAEVSAVDADLMAGEQLERMACVLVFEHEPAEGDVVAGGVLHALEHAVLAEAHEHRGVELGVHAHGQVVSEQRQVGVLADVAEVTLDLARAAKRVEWGGCDERVDAVALRALALVNNAQGFHVDDAGEHGHAMVHDGHSLLQHVIALGVGEEGDLAR